MNLRALAVAGILAIYHCPFAAVAASPAQNEITTVKVFSLPSAKNISPAAVSSYRVTQRFLELYPAIRLESSTALQIEGVGMDAAPLMAIAGGTSPDIIYVNLRQSDTYIREGFLYPLDEYVAKLSPQELAERVPEVLKPVVYREGPTGEKHYWAIPQEVLATVLFYRKDLFAEAGLDPARPPANWKELEEYARQITDPATGRFGLLFYTGPNASWGIFSYLSSAGAKAVIQTPEGNWKATFDTPEAATGYAFADKLMKQKASKNGKVSAIAYRGIDAGTLASEGKIGMFFGSLGQNEIGNFDPDKVAVAPVPQGPTGISSAEINARMMGIYAGVKNKRVRDAAWEYIKFLGSHEARRVYTKSMVELGAAHLINPLWLEQFGYPELAKLAPPDLVETYRNALKNGTPEPYGKNCQFIYSYMSRPLEKLYYSNLEGMTDTQREEFVRNLLKKTVEETNEQMLGQLAPETRFHRNKVAWIVAIVALSAFVIFIVLVFRWMSQGLKKPTIGDRRSSLIALLFIFPAVALILLWQYYPLLRGSVMAFQDYNIMGGSSWVGINNFADILFSPRFWLSLKNAVYFCALWMLMGFLPPVFLAVILQEIGLGKILFRILFYIPAVVSGVVILFMWRSIYDPSPDGILNRLLGILNLPAQSWLQDPKLAMVCVVFPLAWANLGPGSIIYLAALKGIPDELYEASDIDGANFLGKLRSIVLPYLKPLLVINAVGATIFGFKSADAILAMTGGGPDDATQVVGYEIWQQSFLFLKFGQGTAMAWVLGLLLMSFTAYQMRVLARVEFRTANK